MKTNSVYLLFILIVTPALFFGQSEPNELIDGKTISAFEQHKRGDAIILNEDNVINITGKKAAFIDFSITKKVKLEILTQAGLEKYSRFILPETFAPPHPRPRLSAAVTRMQTQLKMP